MSKTHNHGHTHQPAIPAPTLTAADARQYAATLEAAAKHWHQVADTMIAEDGVAFWPAISAAYASMQRCETASVRIGNLIAATTKRLARLATQPGTPDGPDTDGGAA